MAYKPVGADETGHFPPRVEAALSATYGNKTRVVVGPKGDFITLTDALAAYPAGNIDIYIAAATLDVPETLTVSGVKNVSITGRSAFGPTKLTCTAGFIAATGSSDAWTIRNMQITHAAGTNTHDAINVDYPRRWSISGCHFSGFGGASVRLRGGIHCEVVFNYFLAEDSTNTNGLAAIYIEKSSAAVVATTIRTQGNYVGAGIQYGIYADSAKQSVFDNDIIEGCATGFYFKSVSGELRQPYTEANTSAIQIFDSPGLLVTGDLRDQPTVSWSGVASADRRIVQIGARFINPGKGIVHGGTTGSTNLDAAPSIRWGTGSPEGVVTGVVSSKFFRTDGAAGTVEYTKATGTGNTGWVAVGLKPTRVYDLRESAAVGDGVSDDTAAIQAVITSMPQNSRLIGERGKTYLVGELSLTDKSDVVIDGNGATFKLKSTGATLSAFSVGGTGSNIEFRNVRVKGSGVVADKHGGIVGRSDAVLTNVTVADCLIEDVTLGISFSAESVGSALTGVIYRNNRVSNIVGTASGYGYGLHISVANGNVVGAIVDGNVVTAAQRHAIYCAKGSGFAVVNNSILSHRSAISDGSILPAIMIARSTNVTIANNEVLKPKGGALYLGGPSGLTAGAYTVTGNTFSDPQDAANLVYIGQDTPSVDGVPNGVIFSSNSLTSAVARGLMTVYNGLSVTIIGNQFRMMGAGAATALTLTGAGVTGADNMDSITIAQNYFDLDAANPTSKVAVRFSPGHDAHTTKYWFRGNRLIAGASMFTSSATITNPNIAIADQVTTGLSFAAGTASVPFRLDGAQATTAPTAGAGAALPATPAGYFTVNINGTNRQVAYY